MNVFIAVMTGKAPPLIKKLLIARPKRFVAAPTLAELKWAKGRLSPQHPRTRAVLEDLDKILSTIQPHNILVPTHDDWDAAGEIGGHIARALVGATGDLATASDRVELLSDVLIALVAKREKLTIVTEDRHFDLLAQAIPGLDVLFYDRIPPA